MVKWFLKQIEEVQNMTKKTLEKLPAKVRDEIEYLKDQYRGYAQKEYYLLMDITMSRIIGYVRCLMDCGIISDVERRALFCYATLK